MEPFLILEIRGDNFNLQQHVQEIENRLNLYNICHIYMHHTLGCNLKITHSKRNCKSAQCELGSLHARIKT